MLAEERVHERGLAVVELADDDEVEAVLLELLHEVAVDALAQALRAERARDVAEPSERAVDDRSSRFAKNASSTCLAGADGPLCPLALITRPP